MLSITEMAVLGAAALMFFGPEQLPKVARKAGLLMRDIQNTSNQFIREMERAADEPPGGSASYSRAGLIEEAVNPNGGGYVPESYHWEEPAPAAEAQEPVAEPVAHDPVHDAPSPYASKAVPADHDLPP